MTFYYCIGPYDLDRRGSSEVVFAGAVNARCRLGPQLFILEKFIGLLDQGDYDDTFFL